MKPWPVCAAVVMSISLCSAGFLRAEEPPVTPRLKPGQGKLQRGDRLRRIGGQLIDAFESAPAGKSEPLDIGRLNEVIGDLLGPILEQEAAFEHLHFGFDPEETDFAKDKVKFFASAGLKHSAWSSQPTEMEFELRANLDRSSGAPRGAIEGRLLVNTEVIPLANYAIARLAARMDRAAAPAAGNSKDEEGASRPTAEEEFRAQVGERLARSEGISSMDDLVDLITHLSGLRLSTINAEIERLSLEASRGSMDDKGHKRLLEQLDNVRIQRDRLFDLRPRVDRDEHGHAVAFVVTGEQMATGDGPQVDHLELIVNEEQISVTMEASQDRGVEVYSLFKPILMSTLDRLQQRDDGALNLGRSLLDSSFLRARGFLQGQAPPEEPSETESPAEPESE